MFEENIETYIVDLRKTFNWTIKDYNFFIKLFVLQNKV